MNRSLIVLTITLLSLTACGKTVDKQTTAADEVAAYSKVAKTKNAVVDPTHGEEKDFWYGALTAVNDVKANGVGFIHHFADGKFVVTINLNVEPVKKPASFFVQLKNDVTGETTDVGALTSLIGDVRHSATLETSDDLTSRLHVIVTKHDTAGDTGTVIAEGMLKKPSTPVR